MCGPPRCVLADDECFGSVIFDGRCQRHEGEGYEPDDSGYDPDYDSPIAWARQSSQVGFLVSA